MLLRHRLKVVSVLHDSLRSGAPLEQEYLGTTPRVEGLLAKATGGVSLVLCGVRLSFSRASKEMGQRSNGPTNSLRIQAATAPKHPNAISTGHGTSPICELNADQTPCKSSALNHKLRPSLKSNRTRGEEPTNPQVHQSFAKRRAYCAGCHSLPLLGSPPRT